MINIFFITPCVIFSRVAIRVKQFPWFRSKPRVLEIIFLFLPSFSRFLFLFPLNSVPLLSLSEVLLGGQIHGAKKSKKSSRENSKNVQEPNPNVKVSPWTTFPANNKKPSPLLDLTFTSLSRSQKFYSDKLNLSFFCHFCFRFVLFGEKYVSVLTCGIFQQ